MCGHCGGTHGTVAEVRACAGSGQHRPEGRSAQLPFTDVTTTADTAATAYPPASAPLGEPSPPRTAATNALGLKGGWMSYFACRAAPLGAASAPVVTSIFYGFHPRRVERAIPDAWTYAEPRQVIDARLSAMDAALGHVWWLPKRRG